MIVSIFVVFYCLGLSIVECTFFALPVEKNRLFIDNIDNIFIAPKRSFKPKKEWIDPVLERRVSSYFNILRCA